MKNYAIRLAVADDIPQLAAIERAAATIFPPGSIPDAIRDDAVPEELHREGMEKGDLFIAADALNRPVGYALMRFVDTLALLAQLDVHPDHGKQGLGTALIRHAAERARTLGFTALYLTTFTHVPWNAPFYTKLGFAALLPEKLPPAIRLILHAERAAGLANRTAMRLALQ